MSESTTKLSDILKASTEVTSLASTDRVVGCDSTGALRSISMADLLKQIRSSIHIGGRNLLRNTSNFKINTSGMWWLSERLAVSRNSLLSNEDVVVFSAKYKKITSGSASGSFQLGAIVTSNWYEQATFKSSDLADEGVVSKSFEISRFKGDWEEFSLFVNGNSDYEIYDLKLERGNIPTDWSPAPEDLSGGGNSQSFNWLRIEERRCAA